VDERDRPGVRDHLRTLDTVEEGAEADGRRAGHLPHGEPIPLERGDGLEPGRVIPAGLEFEGRPGGGGAEPARAQGPEDGAHLRAHSTPMSHACSRSALE